jgi:hypothetical protein
LLHDEGFDGFGQVGAQAVEEGAAFMFGQAEHAGSRIDEAAHSLVRIAEQALSQGQ